ncbi:hypothetical protein [Deinococcus aquatilis]|uniref:hypothetical protein n=1 Tax=Deinococcus aquatilis TaxID=519440 RepID=UPI00037CEE81|nr:hypothetical protein [Deinococcus aquatilis]
MKAAGLSVRFAALLTLTTALTTGQASTFTELTLTQQAKKAQVIVRATVGAPTTTQSAGVSWINYPLTVTETIAGDVASLPVLEGKPTLMFLAGLQDVPTLNSGQDVFLLLYTGTQDSPLVGFNQGAYPVVNGRVTRWNEAATAAAFAAEAPAQTVTTAPTTNPATGTPATSTTPTSAGTGTAATATTPPATPPVDGATAAVSNPVVPTPTGTPTGNPTSTPTGGTTTPPASTVTPPTTTASGASATTAAPGTIPAVPVPALTGSTAPVPAVPVPVTAPAPVSTSTPTPTPDAFERDPAKFRDQLRAARNTP